MDKTTFKLNDCMYIEQRHPYYCKIKLASQIHGACYLVKVIRVSYKTNKISLMFVFLTFFSNS